MWAGKDEELVLVLGGGQASLGAEVSELSHEEELFFISSVESRRTRCSEVMRPSEGIWQRLPQGRRPRGWQLSQHWLWRTLLPRVSRTRSVEEHLYASHHEVYLHLKSWPCCFPPDPLSPQLSLAFL